MHPSYDILEWESLQDDDPEQALFHAQVINLMPYIALGATIYWLSEEEMTSLLQSGNKSPNALIGERTK